ncbi:MAG: methylated-DNA--[protein]-cysteine S-methyltransferase [Nitrospirae bacterium]|nr:MAG: methylated-DNA--[protein]-cysteine S-methyltransferase [Nitrospirota bacterium]
MKQAVFKTSLGWIGLAATARGVSTVVLPKATRRAVERDLTGRGGSRTAPAPTTAGREGRHIKAAQSAIETYLKGKSRSFNLPIDLDGQTPFQKKVWQMLQTIPYGRVRSYGWVARKIGRPRAARAVGAACGANPVPLLVPCHRVVAGDGSLGGFSGGLPNKKRLLTLEGITF